MLMLTAFSRESVLTLSTDLTKLADEIRASAPHYFLNVPTLLETRQAGVEDNIAKQAAPISRAVHPCARSLAAPTRWTREIARCVLADAGAKTHLRKSEKALRSEFACALICGSAPARSIDGNNFS